MEYTPDPEEDDEMIFVIVKSNLPPREALEYLYKFDQEWFLRQVPVEIASIICITVRPM
jgi:hypothetical protein